VRRMSVYVTESGPDDAAELLDVAAAATRGDGVRPVSEDTELRLRSGAAQTLVVRDEGGVRGWASLADGVAELVVHPDARRAGVGGALVERLRALGGEKAWAHGDLPGARALAARHGATASRLLHQMRRTLDGPLPEPELADGVTLRAFRVG
jgi:mycothiol synthase